MKPYDSHHIFKPLTEPVAKSLGDTSWQTHIYHFILKEF